MLLRTNTMIRFVIALVFTVSFAVSVTAQSKIEKAPTGIFYTFQIPDASENMDGYNIYIPTVCNAPNRNCPVLVFLQGGLGVGGEIEKIYNWALPKMLKEGQTGNKELDKLRLETFIVIMPHIRTGQFFESIETLRAIIEDVNDNYNTNPEAYFLTGLSRGGHGTWGLIDDMNDIFAAAAPICGDDDGIEHYDALQTVPIWVIHNTEDTVVDFYYSARVVDRLEEMGASFFKNTSVAGTPIAKYDQIFTAPELETHDAWTATYSSPEFYLWLLKYAEN